MGIVIASFFSLFINFFLPLNILTNTIAYISIILLFFLKKNNISKKDFIFLLLSSCICFLIIIFDHEYRPDAGLYHIPYVQILNESKIIIGLSNLHSRFAHTSIIQYLSAFNYNIFTKNNGILIPLASSISFLYLYFFNDILKFLKKKNNISIGKLFSLITLIYLSYKINRYSEFGNDAPAHLFLFYLVSKFIYSENCSLKNTKFLYLYSVFAFSNKVFLIFIFLIPFFMFIKNIKNFKKLLFSFPSLILLLWLLKNILISGCLIYPLKNSCFADLKWTNIESVKSSQIEGEAWAKAWPQNKNSNITMEEFSKNFNWVQAWSSVHLKYIVKTFSPYLAVIISIFIFLSFSKKRKEDNYEIGLNNQKYLLLTIIALLGILSFFLKYPIYRYGYSYVIIFLFLILTKIFKKINKDNFLRVSKVMFLICVVTIASKQLLRIYNNFEQKNFVPSYIFVNKKDFSKKYENIKLADNFTVYYSLNECFYGLAPCTSYKQNIKNISHYKNFTFDILYTK